MSLENGIAKVVAIHPEDHSVDLIMLKDGTRYAGVQVLSQSASTNSGLNDLCAPTADSANQWDVTQSAGRQVRAMVGFVDRQPFVYGFLFPQIGEMTFAEKERKVDRHASDFYHTIDADGNAEWYHPSGTYLRVGESPAHEDLTGQDVDGNWKITKNTGRAPHVQLVVASGGAVTCTLHIDPAGNVTVTSAAAGHFTFPAGTTIDTPLATFTGNIKANGNITDSVRSMAADRLIYNGHTHPNNGASPPNQQM